MILLRAHLRLASKSVRTLGACQRGATFLLPPSRGSLSFLAVQGYATPSKSLKSARSLNFSILLPFDFKKRFKRNFEALDRSRSRKSLEDWFEGFFQKCNYCTLTCFSKRETENVSGASKINAFQGMEKVSRVAKQLAKPLTLL